MKKKLDAGKFELKDRVVFVNRTAKVTKGGRNFAFSALIVVGDGHGHVGSGLGKAKEVPEAIAKGIEAAKKDLIEVPLVGVTLPHEVIGKFGSARVMLRPAAPGTGVKAGGAVRAVLEAAGVADVLTKSHGTSNHHNVVHATIDGLKQMKRKEDVARLRGKEMHEIGGRTAPAPAVSAQTATLGAPPASKESAHAR